MRPIDADALISEINNQRCDDCSDKEECSACQWRDAIAIIKNAPTVFALPHGRLIEKQDVFKLIQAFPEVDKLLPVESMEALYNLPSPEEET